MSEADVNKWAKALLIKIHVITGWVIPESAEFLNILIDQFQKKLVEDYPELNPDEIEYAFRSKGTVVEDWGKAMNLNLLDKVLIPYRNERFLLSRMEEQVKPPPPMLPAPEVSDEDFIESVKAVFKIHGNYKLIPELAYKILETEMNLTKEKKLEIRQHITETTKEGDIPFLCRQYAVALYFTNQL